VHALHHDDKRLPPTSQVPVDHQHLHPPDLSPQGLSGHLGHLLVPNLQLAPLLAHHLTAQ
jgi:hypothetical protein